MESKTKRIRRQPILLNNMAPAPEPSVPKSDVLQVFSELTNRIGLAARLGIQYNGSRDLYQALGYKEILSTQDYFDRYSRQDIAKAIIDRPVKASWKGEISVIENSKISETEFEKTWKEIAMRLKLKSIFIRADKLTGLGRYSILFLGLDDAKTTENYVEPVKAGARKLLYVKPFSEQTAKIDSFETDPKKERYGKPLYYQINGATSSGTSINVKVHYTRVVHLVEDLMEDEVYGTPRLQVVYNRLMDLEKLIGGDAEMFWRGARPGYTGKVDDNFTMTTAAMTALQDQIDEYEHNLRRILVNEGVDYKALEQQLAEPTTHVEVQIQMISAVTGIPKRILVGSERGELSSAQDKQEWIAYVTSRREEQNEPMILRPFIDRCIEIGVLPEPKDNTYTVVWDRLFSLSDSEKVDMGTKRASALKTYLDSGPYAEGLVPLDLFLEYFLALDKVQVDKIVEQQTQEVRKEAEIGPEEEDILSKEDKEPRKTTKRKVNV